MDKNDKKCLECGGRMQAFQVIDRGEGNIQYELAYAAGDAKRSLLNKTFTIEGRVQAEMCEDCGLIALRGVPKE